MKKQRKPKPIKSSAEWPDNPVVAEVRAIRAAMWKEAGGDLNAYFDLARREAAEIRRPRMASVKRARGKKGRAA